MWKLNLQFIYLFIYLYFVAIKNKYTKQWSCTKLQGKILKLKYLVKRIKLPPGKLGRIQNISIVHDQVVESLLTMLYTETIDSS